MKFLVWLSIASWACASGCGSTTPTADHQPTGFTFTTAEGTFASFGWTGIFHHIEAVPDTPFAVKATECDNDVCRFEGPVDTGAKVNRQRCLFQMSKTCTMDSDCPLNKAAKPTPCVYIYDAPIATPLPSSDNKSIGACAWTYIPLTTQDGKPTLTGTLNLATGSLNFNSFTALLALNATVPGTFAGVCAECVGDTAANDGVKGGTCQPATHLGPPDPERRKTIVENRDHDMPCDVNRTGTIGYDGNYSMDCSPTLGDELGAPLQVGGSLSSSGIEVSLSPASPNCTASSNEKCFCGMCTDGKTACMSDANCGAGESCSNGLVPVASNLCDGGVCDWDDQEGTGTCTVSTSGTHRTIGCYPSAGTGTGSGSGSGGGSGSSVTISAPGFAQRDPQNSRLYHVNTASAGCIAAGSSAAVNGQVGLPGLIFQKRNFLISAKYAEDPK